MRAQYDNQLISSMYLWLDNQLLTKGSGFINSQSFFYPIKNRVSGYYTYSSPYNQFVSDFSVPGANVPTGIYVGGTYLTTGQNNFVGINYEKGQAFFSAPVTGANQISGGFSIKEFSISLTDKSEVELLFETQMSARGKNPLTPTGLQDNQLTYPIIFLKNQGGYNEPFQFGGTDNTIINVSAYIFADSQFLLDATTCILRDSCKTYVPIFEPSEFPSNALGSAPYNYTGVVANKVENSAAAFISEVMVSKPRQNVYAEIQKVNPEAFFALVDFRLEKAREVRS